MKADCGHDIPGETEVFYQCADCEEEYPFRLDPPN